MKPNRPNLTLLHKMLFPILAIMLGAAVTYGAEPRCGGVFLNTPTSPQSPLWNDLLKEPLVNRDRADRLSDLIEQPQFSKAKGSVNAGMSQADRLNAVRELAIENIVAAPGHRQLRNPKQVTNLKEYILNSKGGDFAHDPILLNLITDAAGGIKSVDLWNAHHRLVAYSLAGYKNIGDLPSQNILILINGYKAESEQWGHFLSIGGIDSAATNSYSTVPVGGEIRVGTVSVDGGRSNFELGSRNTIGRLLKNTMDATPTKVGVYFGTFDPVHEGHIAVAKTIRERYGLDEVIMVPNIDSINKPNASSPTHRLDIMKIRVGKEKGINLYTGASNVIINQFGRDPFIERMTQLYGATEVFQIIGSDSFISSLAAKSISESSNRKFIVVPRDATEKIDVPDNLKPLVQVTSLADPMGVSSTLIRKLIKANEQPPKAILDEDVYRYVIRNDLYR
ncbi:nicotinate-nicotinamide nucleotide adenylyltransferase [Bdellovibrio sp. HCB290]|uniref:nicotinate-nicotinamide nucleotide adenylyltransferase n=1 Tax=Bdellovibrio sp. HCB290 TaxID=3394356 RepID=UPI0039B4F8B3